MYLNRILKINLIILIISIISCGKEINPDCKLEPDTAQEPGLDICGYLAIGYYYNQSEEKCVEYGIDDCGNRQHPFNSLSECQELCESE